MIFFKENYFLIVLLLFATLARFLFLFIYPELNFPDARAYQKIAVGRRGTKPVSIQVKIIGTDNINEIIANTIEKIPKN